MSLLKEFTFKVIGEEIYYRVKAQTVHMAEIILLEKHKELNRYGLRIVREGRLVLLCAVTLA